MPLHYFTAPTWLRIVLQAGAALALVCGCAACPREYAHVTVNCESYGPVQLRLSEGDNVTFNCDQPGEKP
jgi:hypothetical protein